MTYIVPVAFATMVVSALLLPTRADRFRGALGIPAFVLGVASIPFLPAFRGPSLTVWISGGLLVLGPGLLALAAWRARSRLSLGALAPWAILVAVAAGLAAAWPTLDRGGALPAVLTAGALAFGSLLDWMVAEKVGLGRAIRWLDERMPALRGRYSWGTMVFVTGAIGFRLAWLVWPLWVLSWQPIGVGLGVLGVVWAAATGRVPLALAAAAFAASFTAPEATVGGWLVLAAAAMGNHSRPRLLALAAAFGSYLVWPALLDQEVVFTVLLTAATTALLAQLALQASTEERAPR